MYDLILRKKKKVIYIFFPCNLQNNYNRIDGPKRCEYYITWVLESKFKFEKKKSIQVEQLSEMMMMMEVSEPES